ncbi:hypothetical protein Tco_0466035 [Tanacetum coccineum]
MEQTACIQFGANGIHFEQRYSHITDKPDHEEGKREDRKERKSSAGPKRKMLWGIRFPRFGIHFASKCVCCSSPCIERVDHLSQSDIARIDKGHAPDIPKTHITPSLLGLVQDHHRKNKQTPQGSARTTSAVDLEEFCEKHYEKLLPIMADKYECEQRKKEKLEEVKARLDFGEARRRPLGRRTETLSQPAPQS